MIATLLCSVIDKLANRFIEKNLSEANYRLFWQVMTQGGWERGGKKAENEQNINFITYLHKQT